MIPVRRERPEGAIRASSRRPPATLRGFDTATLAARARGRERLRERLPPVTRRDFVAAGLLPTRDYDRSTNDDGDIEKLTLYRPTGPDELALIAASEWRTFPPRLPDHPIFYPVLTEEYATRIARDWNAKDGKTGYVLRFEVPADVLERWPPQQGAAGAVFRELWVPAQELDDFNACILGAIEIIGEYESD